MANVFAAAAIAFVEILWQIWQKKPRTTSDYYYLQRYPFTHNEKKWLVDGLKEKLADDELDNLLLSLHVVLSKFFLNICCFNNNCYCGLILSFHLIFFSHFFSHFTSSVFFSHFTSNSSLTWPRILLSLHIFHPIN